MLAVGLMLTAGCKKDELRAKDARIAELESVSQDTAAALEQCKEDRANLNTLVKGYTGEINAMEAALAEAAAREARAAKRLEEYRSMLKQLKSMIDAGKLNVRVVRNKMVVELPEAVLFASGSAKLKEEGVRVLAEVGPVLASLGERQFQVGGHTDNKPIRTKRFPSNWELSGARGIEVTKLLIEYGVPATRISAAAYADTQPVASNDTPEGRALNRRIEIALQPSLDELPDLSDIGIED
ncbi:MAG TPA: flagellar motor protein MotB [Polyangiales bacterium]|nr:flagellar motor protein MotB [Polyangiales bacterium]